MNAFVTGVSMVALWASLSAGVFAATPSALELHPSTAVPGATVSIGGKGFPAFRSVQVNRVTVGGFPALIQRWESDLIEVKVPLQAQSGPVEIMAGKKKKMYAMASMRPLVRGENLSHRMSVRMCAPLSSV